MVVELVETPKFQPSTGSGIVGIVRSLLSFINLFNEPLIPVLAETTNHRTFQEFIQWNTFFLAFAFSWNADAPLVIVHIDEAVFLFEADRIKVAAYWFPEVDFAFEISLFYSA